jgi:hypothetical protein
MKILIVGNPSVDSFGFHLHYTLRNSEGIDVTIYDYYLFKNKFLRFFIRNFPRIFFNYHKLNIKTKKLFDCDLLISTYKDINHNFIKLFREKNIYTVSINPDHLGTLGNQELIRCGYDEYWVKCRIMFKQLRLKTDLNVFLYDEVYNPDYHYIEKKEFLYDLVLIGSMYPYRENFIKNFLKILNKHLNNKINILIVGNKPLAIDNLNNLNLKFSKFVFLEQKHEIFSKTKLVVNQMHICEIASTNAKFIEFFAFGVPQLVDNNNYISTSFSENFKNYFSFDGVEDCVNKAINFLKDPSKGNMVYNDLRKKILKDRRYIDLVNRVLNNYDNSKID